MWSRRNSPWSLIGNSAFVKADATHVNVRIQNEKRQSQDLYKDLLRQLSSFENTRIAGHQDLVKPENKAALDRAVKDQRMRAAGIPDRRGCGHLVLPGTPDCVPSNFQLDNT